MKERTTTFVINAMYCVITIQSSKQYSNAYLFHRPTHERFPCCFPTQTLSKPVLNWPSLYIWSSLEILWRFWKWCQWPQQLLNGETSPHAFSQPTGGESYGCFEMTNDFVSFVNEKSLNHIRQQMESVTLKAFWRILHWKEVIVCHLCCH